MEEDEEKGKIKIPPPSPVTEGFGDLSKYLNRLTTVSVADYNAANGTIDDEEEAVDLEEIDTERKLAYGIEQETTIGGNLMRYGKALMDSSVEDESFSEALSNIEDRRQKDIFRRYPEFEGLQETEEDATILAGRIGVAVFDPVTWLVPWTKVAKAGKIASIATAGGVAAGDAALREKMIYGEINPISVGFATVFGGAAGAISAKLAGKISAEAREEVLSAVKDVKPTKIDIDPKDGIPITPEQAVNVEAAAKRVVSASVQEEVQAMPSFTSRWKKSREMGAVIKKLRKQKKKATTKAEKAEIQKSINEQELGRRSEREKVLLETLRMDRLIKENSLKVAEDLSERGELTRGILKTLVFEPTRPIMGAVGGYAVSGILGDEDDDALTIGMMVAGAGLGNWATLLKRSKLTDFDKEGAMEVVNDVASKFLHREAKIATAGGTAMRMDAMGGWAKAIGKMMFGTVGGPHQGLEDQISRHTREYVNQIRAIFGDSFNDIQVEKVVGARLRGFVKAQDIKVGYKGLDGSAEGLTSEQVQEVRRLIPLVRKHQNIIKGGMDDSGIVFKELDDYGMAQLWDFEAIAKNEEGFLEVLTEAIKKQKENFSIRVGQLESTLGELQAPMKVGTKLDTKLGTKVDPDIKALKTEIASLKSNRQGLTAPADTPRLTEAVKLEKESLSRRIGQLESTLVKLEKGKVTKEKSVLSDIKSLKEEIAFLKSRSSLTAKRFSDSLRGITAKKGKQEKATFYKSMFDSDGTFRPLAQHFEWERQLVDKEASAIMAKAGFLNMNAREVVETYGEKSIKIMDFARKFGAEGELIIEALKDVKKAFHGANLERFEQQYRRQIVNAVDGFWGLYQKDHGVDERASRAVAGFTALANMSFLTRVSITSLGDLIQPFQNSGFGATSRALLQKADPNKISFSKQANFRYNDGFEKEITAMTIKGGDPLNMDHRRIANYNRKFFKAVGLQHLTNTARDFAFDTGVNRAFKLATKKGKLTKANRSELDQLGLYVEDLDVIKKYKTVQEAFDAGDARNILDKAGLRSANRDAIIPSVGNRLLFAQSNNPFIKSLGQFASWAQAKSSQTNALAERIDNGDAALALRMLGLTTIYGGVSQMREWAKPTYDDDKGKMTDFISVKGLKKSLELSGNWVPWHIDKAVRMIQGISYGSGVVESAVPAVSFIGEGVERGYGIGRNLSQGDIKGAGSHALRAFPVLKDFVGWSGRLGDAAGYDIKLEDKPYRKDEDDWRLGRAIGGVVEDVPQAPKEPDERIDKMTGRPYNEQAGGAFIDAEDPLRRLGFVGGGLADNPLRRLGFGWGGIASAVTRRFWDDVVPTSKVAKEADEILKRATKEVEELKPTSTAQKLDEPIERADEFIEEAPVAKADEAIEEAPPTKTDYDKVLSEFEDIDDVGAWQKARKTYVKENREIDPVIRTPKLEESAQKLIAGEIDRPQHLRNIEEHKPIRTWEFLPEEPSTKTMVYSLNSAQRKDGNFVIDSSEAQRFNVSGSILSIGDKFNGRLDIPAYESFDAWIVAGTSQGIIKGTHYAKAIHYVGKGDKLVKFAASQKKGERIGTAVDPKGGYATVSGWIKDLDAKNIRKLAEEVLDDPDWVQVGFDPRRQGAFYTRSGDNIGAAVKDAEEVIQIGPLVLAKKAKIDLEYEGYVEGGKVYNALRRRRAEGGKLIVGETENDLSYLTNYDTGSVRKEGADPEEVSKWKASETYEKHYKKPTGDSPRAEGGLENAWGTDWYNRATDPQESYLEDEEGRHTLLTASSELDGKEILYPTIRKIDGELKRLSAEEARRTAIEKGDYITFDTPEEATEASIAISDSIEPERRSREGTKASPKGLSVIIDNLSETIFNDDEASKKMMHEIMQVESRAGEDERTYTIKETDEKRGGLGVMQIDEIEFDEIKRRLIGGKDIPSSLLQFRDTVSQFADKAVKDIKYEDLHDDTLNIIFGRLSLRKVAESIPEDVEGRAMYWVENYNKSIQSGKYATVEAFESAKKEKAKEYLARLPDEYLKNLRREESEQK